MFPRRFILGRDAPKCVPQAAVIIINAFLLRHYNLGRCGICTQVRAASDFVRIRKCQISPATTAQFYPLRRVFASSVLLRRLNAYLVCVRVYAQMCRQFDNSATWLRRCFRIYKHFQPHNTAKISHTECYRAQPKLYRQGTIHDSHPQTTPFSTIYSWQRRKIVCVCALGLLKYDAHRQIAVNNAMCIVTVCKVRFSLCFRPR